jgi:resuscitation-promoting factor RpfB
MSFSKLVLPASLVLILVSLQLVLFSHSGTSADVDKSLAKLSHAQNFQVSSSVVPQTIVRDTYTITDPPKPPPATAVKGDAQAYARGLVANETEWTCLSQLWSRESGWRWDAENKSSGAYGIPQSLPGSKMARAGDDWKTNYKTQIDWGLWYIANSSYKTPCAAWAHSEAVGWY